LSCAPSSPVAARTDRSPRTLAPVPSELPDQLMSFGRITTVLIAVAFACSWLAWALPALMPYISVLFVMAVVGRLLWHYTRGW
jgi:hypothetical protein